MRFVELTVSLWRRINHHVNTDIAFLMLMFLFLAWRTGGTNQEGAALIAWIVFFGVSLTWVEAWRSRKGGAVVKTTCVICGRQGTRGFTRHGLLGWRCRNRKQCWIDHYRKVAAEGIDFHD